MSDEEAFILRYARRLRSARFTTDNAVLESRLFPQERDSDDDKDAVFVPRRSGKNLVGRVIAQYIEHNTGEPVALYGATEHQNKEWTRQMELTRKVVGNAGLDIV